MNWIISAQFGFGTNKNIHTWIQLFIMCKILKVLFIRRLRSVGFVWTDFKSKIWIPLKMFKYFVQLASSFPMSLCRHKLISDSRNQFASMSKLTIAVKESKLNSTSIVILMRDYDNVDSRLPSSECTAKEPVYTGINKASHLLNCALS